ncbi:hypothetical protein H8K47_04580 [Undibacterium sp. CY7W]|uniref:Lipoprotein n=1 Tax=Undibacterium rugosum TaxID=2762291 RepID=A0A923KUU9_9BURK|nr:hypothetical protein [Undibacterium rugosum]MBC3934627.1 hypothetical protein [Undibacterium rugosum]
MYLYTLRSVSSLLGFMVSGLVLTACGGGGGGTGGGSSSTTESPVPQKTFQRQIPLAGDSFTYQHQVKDDKGLSWTYYSTEIYWNPYRNATGSLSILNDKLPKTGYFFAGTNTSATFSYSSYYDANGAEILFSPRSASVLPCSFAQPYQTAQSPYTVGQSWDVNAVLGCNSGSAVSTYKTVRDTGNVAAVEDVTVAAGKFTALKEVMTLKEVTNRTTPSANVAETSKDLSRTCWRDTISGQYVKCVATGFDADFQSATPGGSKNLSISSELIGRLNISNAGVKVLPRFAGRWSLTIGADTRTNFIEIDQNGVVSKVFELSAGGLTTDATTQLLNASVSNEGDLSFTLSTPAANGINGMNGSFSGKLDTVVSGSGTLKLSNGYTGTWKMTRL